MEPAYDGTRSDTIPLWYGVADGRVAISSRIKSFVTKVHTFRVLKGIKGIN